jgi:hypothetical protein
MMGASCSLPNNEPVFGKTYYYWIEAVNPDGSTFSGPITLTTEFGLFVPIIVRKNCC